MDEISNPYDGTSKLLTQDTPHMNYENKPNSQSNLMHGDVKINLELVNVDHQSDSDGDPAATPLIRNMEDLEKRVISDEDLNKDDKIDEKFPKMPNKKYFEDIKEKIDEELDGELGEEDVVIVAAMFLPYLVRKNDQGEFTVSQSNSMLYSKIYDRDEGKAKHTEVWIGWSGYFTNNEEEKAIIAEKLITKKCIPIWLEEKQVHEFFNFFEMNVIPLFHNFKTHLEHRESYDQFDNWSCYKMVNKIFSDNIVSYVNNQVKPFNKNPLVWINNIHLIMTPLYLRNRIPDIASGLYLHSPFPASELFKIIPYRESLLKSMLNSDAIGFHSFEYARNFFTTCKRVLGVNFEYRRTGQLGIDYHGRNVSLCISHVGISYDSIKKRLNKKGMKNLIRKYKESKKKIISSVDSFSHIAGIREKLEAFQLFLRSDPSHAKNCKLVQYIEPSGSFTKELNESYLKQIKKLAKDISTEFGNEVLSLRFESLSEDHRLLLWARTNILLNTTLRGGLRLPSLEYIAVREILGLESKSLIILSEFAGGIRVLPGVIK